MFIEAFTDGHSHDIAMPSDVTVGEEWLKLFYKYIWDRLRHPVVDEIGR